MPSRFVYALQKRWTAYTNSPEIPAPPQSLRKRCRCCHWLNPATLCLHQTARYDALQQRCWPRLDLLPTHPGCTTRLFPGFQSLASRGRCVPTVAKGYYQFGQACCVPSRIWSEPQLTESPYLHPNPSLAYVLVRLASSHSAVGLILT